MIYQFQLETYNSQYIYKNLRVLRFLIAFFLRAWTYLLNPLKVSLREKNILFPKLSYVSSSVRRSSFTVIRSSHIFNKSKEHFIRKRYKVSFFVFFCSTVNSRDMDKLLDSLIAFCLYFLPSIFAFRFSQRKKFFL